MEAGGGISIILPPATAIVWTLLLAVASGVLLGKCISGPGCNSKISDPGQICGKCEGNGHSKSGTLPEMDHRKFDSGVTMNDEDRPGPGPIEFYQNKIQALEHELFELKSKNAVASKSVFVNAHGAVWHASHSCASSRGKGNPTEMRPCKFCVNADSFCH